MVAFLHGNDELKYLTDNSKQNLPSVIKNFDGDNVGSLTKLVSKYDEVKEKVDSTFATPNWFPAIVALTNGKSEKWP